MPFRAAVLETAMSTIPSGKHVYDNASYTRGKFFRDGTFVIGMRGVEPRLPPYQRGVIDRYTTLQWNQEESNPRTPGFNRML